MWTKLIKGNIAIGSLGVLCLIAGLTGCAPQDKSLAIVEWQADGRADKIIKLLIDPVQAIRLEAIEALAEMKAEEAIQPLGTLFTDPDLIVVHAAIDAVAEIGGSDIEPLMLKAIKLETVPARVTGAATLGRFKSDEAVDALIMALDDVQYEQIVLAAINSLGEIGDPRAVEPLGAKVKERSDTVREAAIRTLSQVGNDAALQMIATRLGDAKESIRQLAVDALLEGGEASAQPALEALRSENRLARVNAVAVLNGLEAAVPVSGSDGVWFQLAVLTSEKNAPIEPAKAESISAITNAVPALLEGLMHEEPAIRAYASIALENVGESATEEAVELVSEKASEEAKAWFEQRSKWLGAPSWRLDLWGSVTALSPKFKFNPTYVKLLGKGGKSAEDVMTAQQFIPHREIIESLLLQLKGTDSTEPAVKEWAEKNRALAEGHLMKLGHNAVFPLVAALGGDDAEIAVQSARILNAMDGARVEQMVINEYTLRFDGDEESETEGETVAEEETVVAEAMSGDEEVATGEELEVKPNPLDELSGTPLHLAIFEFDYPELKTLSMQIRPVPAVALRAFKEKHPDMTVINLPLQGETASEDRAPIRLSYYKNGKMNDLMVVYQRNSEGAWALDAPIPDELP